MNQPSVVVALCTCPSADVARRLATELLDARLIACANLIDGVRSLYRWNGEVCDDAEVLMVIKTTPDRFEAMKTRLVASHPYDVPEVLALTTVGGHVPYLDWVAGAVAPADSIPSS